MQVLLGIVLALAAGLLSTRLVKLIHLPNVTGYLVAGLLIGVVNIITYKRLGTYILDVKSLSIIVDLALGFIAFSIGGEFKLTSLKKLGKSIFTITFLQSFLALVLVDVFVIVAFLCMGNLNNENAALAIILGAIATATAPAATLMVVRQYKAKGPVTDTLLPVVALDDAFGLMFFSISFAIAKALAEGAKLTVMTILVLPLAEIICSLLIGAILGALLSLATKWFKSRANRLCLMVLFEFAGVVICELFEHLQAAYNFPFGLSSLLLCMMIGAMFCNMCEQALVIMDGCERWTPPLFMLFFVLSGAELDVRNLASIGVVGVVYLVARCSGKYFGARLGAKVVHADENVTKYLGLTLFPQAGVAIGMAQMVSNKFSGNPLTNGIAVSIITIVLSATLIYELLGPVITKIALQKAGEIDESTLA